MDLRGAASILQNKTLCIKHHNYCVKSECGVCDSNQNQNVNVFCANMSNVSNHNHAHQKEKVCVKMSNVRSHKHAEHHHPDYAVVHK